MNLRDFYLLLIFFWGLVFLTFYYSNFYIALTLAPIYGITSVAFGLFAPIQIYRWWGNIRYVFRKENQGITEFGSFDIMIALFLWPIWGPIHPLARLFRRFRNG